MSVVVYIENTEGKFKKSSFEIISFAAAIAKKLNLSLTALSIGKVSSDELQKASEYGASKILNVSEEKLSSMNAQAYAGVIAEAAKAEQAKIVVMSAGFSGKCIAPRVAVKLDAGLGENVIDLPVMDGTFVVKKGAFSGKAFSFVEIISDVKVISVLPNSYKVVLQPIPEIGRAHV